jgi:hypothetical protein
MKLNPRFANAFVPVKFGSTFPLNPIGEENVNSLVFTLISGDVSICPKKRINWLPPGIEAILLILLWINSRLKCPGSFSKTPRNIGW